ncbi:MAG TPA: hypothetical protein VGJ05_11780 [Fimbriiglobus sp.]|jgi:ABC-type transport system involved in multi-copper enzyme maturation permease subunit
MPIFDQGYQHWQGSLSGHRWRWLAVTRHGVRSLMKNWIVRLILLIAWLPTLGLVTALTIWGLFEQQNASIVAFLQRMLNPDVVAHPQEYRIAVWTIAYSIFFKAELICSLFLVLFVGPNLVSRDLRFNAFPLYFSRPIRRIDYFLGKLGVIGYVLAATIVVPAVGAYLLGLAFSLDLGVVRDTYRILFAGILYGLIITVSAGTLMLALSSLSRRSIYVGLTWAGFVFLSFMLSTVLLLNQQDTYRQEISSDGIARWVHDHPPPPGIELRGPYVSFRGDMRWMYGAKPGDPPLSKEDREKQRWYGEYSRVQAELYSAAEEVRIAQGKTDWRPLLSYAANLDRMSDWLLDTDSAWVTFGRPIERTRAMIGPVAKGQGIPIPSGPPNERLLADRNVWQYPWYWSAATLTGIWLISVFILSRRVKSLDRLK